MLDFSSWLLLAANVCTLCTLAAFRAQSKVRSGVSFDDDIAGTLDRHADSLRESGVTRSEVVNAVLADYLERSDSTEMIWEVVTKRRAKRRG